MNQYSELEKRSYFKRLGETRSTLEGERKMTRLLTIILLLHIGLNSCFAQSEGINTDSQKQNIIANILGKEIKGDDISPNKKALEQMKGKMTDSQFDAWLHKYQVDRLKQLIGDALIKRFLREEDIKPIDEEIKRFISKSTESEDKLLKGRIAMHEKLLPQLKSPDLSSSERERLNTQLQTIESSLKTDEWRKQYAKDNPARDQEVKQKVAVQFIRAWKIKKYLYDKYGGRVIFQQAGPEPIDAYLKFLKEHEQNASFQIIDESFIAPFWDYYTNDKIHTFLTNEEGIKAMTTPWWNMEEVK